MKAKFYIKVFTAILLSSISTISFFILVPFLLWKLIVLGKILLLSSMLFTTLILAIIFKKDILYKKVPIYMIEDNPVPRSRTFDPRYLWRPGNIYNPDTFSLGE